MVYIGAEHIISPLGTDAVSNFRSIQDGVSGIHCWEGKGLGGNGVFLSCLSQEESKFEKLLMNVLTSLRLSIDPDILHSDRTLLLISSTKGDITQLNDPFGATVSGIASHFGLKNYPVVVSNACISGVLSIVAGCDFIEAGCYDHVIVAGCDVVSDFVLFGFQSLYAVSDGPCRPFDQERKGVTLGEGAAVVVLSASKLIFKEAPLALLGGSSSNDANHISGPSRTGEGLFRSVIKTLKRSSVSIGEIDFISAHGTATAFNDEMESIAFDRLGLNEVPLNSLKGYFGHTLGAAGVIEVVISMQSMRQRILVKSMGYETCGVTKPLNIVTENRSATLDTVLKTASGFGGCNASLIFQKI